jgi:cytidine deaminase
MADDDALLERARAVRQQAYAPYSRFHVGAVLEAEDGSLHLGCNVENASYPLTMCAERNAIAAAVAAGRRRFRTLAVSVSGAEAVAPCGGCRQALAEFGTDLRIVSEGAGGGRRDWTLAELLPDPFLSVAVRSEGEAPASARPTGQTGKVK